MPRQTLQSSAHVYKLFHRLVRLVEASELRIHFHGLFNGDIQFCGDHLGNRITLGIGKVHDPAHITDDTSGSHGTEGDDLHHPVLAVLLHHIVNDLLPPLETEIHVDIRHGYTFRVQETLKEQIVFDGVQFCDPQSVGYKASRGGTTSRSHNNVMVPGIPDKIPYDQEIIHIPHVFDNIQLIVQAFFQFLHIPAVTCGKTVKAELIQILPGIVSLRHIEFRQLRHAEFNFHITAHGNLVGVFQGLGGIRKQSRHFFYGFHVVLAALVAHPILIRKPLACLHAQQDVMGFRVRAVGVVDIIGCHQFYPGLPAHTHKLLIDPLLFRYSMILQLQKEIPFSENLFVAQSCLF